MIGDNINQFEFLCKITANKLHCGEILLSQDYRLLTICCCKESCLFDAQILSIWSCISERMTIQILKNIKFAGQLEMAEDTKSFQSIRQSRKMYQLPDNIYGNLRWCQIKSFCKINWIKIFHRKTNSNNLKNVSFLFKPKLYTNHRAKWQYFSM